MTTYYVKSGSGVTQFAQSTAYSSGDRIVPLRSDTGTNHLTAKNWVWECTTGGTTAGANPTWPATVTQDVTTVTSNTAVFTARRPGFSSGSTANWTFASIFLDYICNTGTYAPNGKADVVYVSNNHAESVAAARIIDFRGSSLSTGYTTVLCVDDSAAPPTALATTAVIENTGSNNLTLDHFAFVYGITFKSAANILYDTGSWIRAEKCGFWLTGTSTASRINVTNAGGNCGYEWIDCDVKFGNVSQGIEIGAGGSNQRFIWRGGSILAGGSAITALLKSQFGGYCDITIDGVDLSNADATLVISASASVWIAASRLKLPASWSGSLSGSTVPTGMPYFPQALHIGDSANTNYRSTYNVPYGRVDTETTLVRTGGASDGTTPISWKFQSSADTHYPVAVAVTDPMEKWNEITGSAITLSIEILHDSATNLKDDEVWLEVDYMDDSGSPTAAVASDRAVPLATAADQTASSATWTTTGMSNPNKQTLAVTITPQKKGPLVWQVCMAKASKTIYVDPLLTIS